MAEDSKESGLDNQLMKITNSEEEKQSVTRINLINRWRYNECYDMNGCNELEKNIYIIIAILLGLSIKVNDPVNQSGEVTIYHSGSKNKH